METTASITSSTSISNTFFHRNTRRRTIVFSSRKHTFGSDYGGWLVDQNMTVLRKRLHEMKMAEKNYEPPSDWSEWEKKYHKRYEQGVCEVVGLVQNILMNTRPSLAIGMVFMLLFSVPSSITMIMLYFIDGGKSLFS